MGQILVWECEKTGELFRKEADYLANKRKLKRQLVLEERARRVREAEIEAIQPIYRRGTFRALEHWIREHASFIRAFRRPSYGRDRTEGSLLKVQFHDMRWGDQSCTHSAPLGKPRAGWDRNDPNPRTYPGWRGRITLYFDGDSDRFTDALTAVGICTGGGGGGSWRSKKYPHGCKLSYDVTLWGQDFPKLVPKSSEFIDDKQSRTEASLVHDIFHFDRLTLTDRAEKWTNLMNDLQTLRKLTGDARRPSAYCALWDDNAAERQINYAARAFGKELPYFVTGTMNYKEAEKLRYRIERGDYPGRFLLRFQGMPLVTSDIDHMIALKLSGGLTPSSQITDLAKRRVALGI